MLLKANHAPVVSFGDPLLSPAFVGRLSGTKTRQVRCDRRSQALGAEVSLPSLRDGALHLVTQFVILFGSLDLLHQPAIIQGPMQAAIVVQGLKTVLFPFREAYLKIGDRPAARPLCQKHGRVNETPAEIVCGVKALSRVADNAIDPVPEKRARQRIHQQENGWD